MTKDEALKLALEALEHEADKGNDDAYKVERDAIKEALAQPEVFSKQNYLNGYCVGQSDLLAEQAKLEPAAWMVYTQDGQSVYVTDNPTDIQENQRALPMYTTPPQRTWVGLTEEEIEGFVNALWPVGAGAGKLLRAIEAKLKEKNT